MDSFEIPRADIFFLNQEAQFVFSKITVIGKKVCFEKDGCGRTEKKFHGMIVKMEKIRHKKVFVVDK